MFGKKKPEPQHLIIEVAKSDAKKPSESELRAQKFVLTDEQGKTRAQFQCVAGGAVALTFHDGEGKMGLLLGLDPHQSPTLAMVKDGRMKANLELGQKTSQPMMSLQGKGKQKIEMGFDKTDNAAVRFHDEDGSLRMTLSLSSKGDAQIKLFDHKGYVVNEMKGFS